MPIRFTCPHCGNATDVAEEYAGQSGACVQCGKTITVPSLTAAPLEYNQFSPRKPRSAAAKILIAFAVSVPIILLIGSIIAGLVLPAMQAGREAAKLTKCQSNLQQISVAMQAYYDQNGHYPPAYIADKDGNPMHSWRVLLLPYLGEQLLYSQYNMNEPWNGPQNKLLANRMPDVYRCPNPKNLYMNLTSYAMLVGPHAISTGKAGRTKAEITDGLANTIMIVETAGSNINWLEPRDLDVEIMSFDLAENAGTELNSEHPESVNVLFCDGHVQSLSKATDPDTLKAMTTIDGAEQTTPGDVLEPVSK